MRITGLCLLAILLYAVNVEAACQVTNPANGATKRDAIFVWTITVPHTSSKVTIGSSPGTDLVYSGTEKPKGVTVDYSTVHPRDGRLYYTRVKYRKIPNGTWYTTLCAITTFISAQ